LTGLIPKIRETLEKFSPVTASLYGVHRALTCVSQSRYDLVSYHLVAQPTKGSSASRKSVSSSTVIREIGPSEVADLPMPRPPEILRRRLEQNAICFAAFRGEEMIGFLWLVLGPYEEDEVRCRFQPEPEGLCAWDFDVYVAPEYRLGRTFSRLWAHANAWLHERGICWTMSRISSFNAASMASHRRLGARFVGRALFLRFGTVQITWSSLGPRFHISRHRSPLIRVPVPPD